MLYQNHSQHSARRQAVILLVVISLLTLFAIIGISFVLYANAEANASKIFRDAASQNQPDMDPEMLLNFFMNQLLYDVPDDSTGVYSALRGYSLARSMYGYNYDPTKATLIANTTPFNGVGRLHTTGTTTPPTYMNPFYLLNPPNPIDDWQLVNYTYFPNDPQLKPPQTPIDYTFLRDPERINPNPAAPLPWRSNPTQPPGPYTGGANVPYTYPDLNNMFLAAVKADGTVLMPSFFRPWTGFNPAGINMLDPANPNWMNNTDPVTGQPAPWLKYMVLRPRPADNPGFPLPEDGGGDVKNLPGPGTLIPGTGTGPNNPPQYWNNDSVWLDLGAPVMTAPDGTKFKALFAPLIIDLDGRVNLNVAGNIRGLNNLNNISPALILPDHRSNQGWGPWEANLQWVLGSQIQAGANAWQWNPTTQQFTFQQQTMSNLAYEWPNLLLGNGILSGRYGPNQIPDRPAPPNIAQSGATPHPYGQVDFDGADELNNYMQSGPINPPAAPGNAFPTYTNGYGNGSNTERANHPLLFNYFQTNGDDRVFPLSNMEALLRYGDTNSPAMSSDLFRLCPNNFQNDPRTRTDGSKWYARNLLTSLSFDVDVPGNTPWVWDPADPSTPSTTYTYPAMGPDYTKPPPAPSIPFPSLLKRLAGNPPANSEFTVDWRAIDTAVGKVNLNRYLTPYPSYSDTTHPMLTAAYWSRYDDATNTGAVNQFSQAQADRQQLAQDIYTRLLAATGAYQPATISGPNDSNLAPLRWLAQLAVNIVDYIDEDDISTPFNFFPNGTYPAGSNASKLPGYWVFGTELPHVVLNEVLGEYQINPNPPKVGQTFPNRLWVELFNPFPNTVPANTQQADSQPVLLDIPALGLGVPSASNAISATSSYPPYQLVFDTQFYQGLPTNENVLGEPDAGNLRTQTKIVTATTADADFSGPVNVTGGAGAGTAAINAGGTFIIGPKTNSDTANKVFNGMPAQVPAGVPWLQTDSLTYQSTINMVGPPPTFAPNDSGILKVVLRRLANPHLPYQPDPTAADKRWYNPYITVDYIDNIKIWDMTQPKSISQSQGKLQPYAADPSQVAVQGQTPAAGSGTTAQTFGQVNNNNGNPVNNYDWLVHLDRQLVSPMELLEVSGYQPWQLTHYFRTLVGPNQHLVHWYDDNLTGSSRSYRLYRLFEFLETSDRAAGTTPGGRVPGKVNINTIWDPEPLLAYCDPQQGNFFKFSDIYNQLNPTDTNTVFGELMALRSPNTTPGASDKPFLSMGTGLTSAAANTQYPSGIDINSTFLRYRSGLTQLLFQTGAATDHPYLRNQLMTKLFNNVTTRSNVFAVFVTVGFFQVTNDQTRPVQLGAEIGKAENRHIRHRMFAIVDRSNLTTDAASSSTIAPPPVYITGDGSVPTPPSGGTSAATINIAAMSGTYEGISWNIQPQTPGPFTALPAAENVILGSNLIVDVGSNREIVNVTNVNPLATPPTFSANFAMAHSGPFAISFANSVTAYGIAPGYTALPAGSGLPSPPAPPTVLGVSFVSGTFEGVSWAFQPGTNILLDPGPNQELAIVTGLLPPTGLGLPPNIVIQSANPAGFQKPHTAPFAISYPTPVGGNPGPQANFDMRQVPWVVRHISIIN